jgi:hypothetical protein
MYSERECIGKVAVINKKSISQHSLGETDENHEITQ